MTRKPGQSDPSSTERATHPHRGDGDAPADGASQLVEELSVQRVELEAQKHELEGVQVELVRSREAFRELFHAAPVGYVGIDDRGMIRKVNETFAEFLGVEAAALVATPLGRWVAPEDERSFFGRIRSYLRHPEDKCWELRFVRRDGSRIWLRAEGRRVDGTRWRVLGAEMAFLIAFMDVTALREMADREQALETKVRQVQKLESLGVLAGGIAHDFNNLLATIMGNVELAMMDLDEDHPSSELLRAVMEAADSAAGLCRQMLAYAGRRSLSSASLDLASVVDGMGRIFASSLSKGISLVRDLRSVPEVMADSSQLQQVIMNLVTNAAEAMEGREGEIHVHLTHRPLATGERDGLVLDSLPSDQRFVVLTVRDQGCGMDEETRRAMFDPFFTTKFTGRGLGLAAVIGILRAHRGGVGVQSEPGTGSTITVYLPVAPSSRGMLEAANGSSQEGIGGKGGGGMIFLVDDEAGVRSAVRRMLMAAGFEVEEAVDGVEALAGIARLVEAQRLPACIILDMTMPRKGGKEVFEDLESLAPHVPVIITSGYSAEEMREGFEGRLPAAFLQKPYRRRELVALLGRLLRRVESGA